MATESLIICGRPLCRRSGGGRRPKHDSIRASCRQHRHLLPPVPSQCSFATCLSGPRPRHRRRRRSPQQQMLWRRARLLQQTTRRSRRRCLPKRSRLLLRRRRLCQWRCRRPWQCSRPARCLSHRAATPCRAAAAPCLRRPRRPTALSASAKAQRRGDNLSCSGCLVGQSDRWLAGEHSIAPQGLQIAQLPAMNTLQLNSWHLPPPQEQKEETTAVAGRTWESC